jgi:hypothetical protein
MNTKIAGAKTEAAAMLEAGAEISKAKPEFVTSPSGRLYGIRPEGYVVDDLTGTLAAPLKLKQDVRLATAQSLVDYVNLFGTKEGTMVFVVSEPTVHSVTALLDYHKSPSEPSWIGHRAVFFAAFSRQWKTWSSASDVPLSQKDFARFLDSHITEIANPAGGVLAEIVRKIEAMKTVRFQSHQRETDGSVKFVYEEDVQGASTNGSIAIPTDFTLVMPIFEGDAPKQFNAKLAYRLKASELTLYFTIEQQAEIVDEAFKAVVEKITKDTANHARAVLYGATPQEK